MNRKKSRKDIRKGERLRKLCNIRKKFRRNVNRLRRKRASTARMIPLNRVLMDEKIADIVEANGGDINGYAFFSDPNTFKLLQKRLISILRANPDNKIPPITVSFALGGRYKVSNGRHRIACALLNRKTDINCVVRRDWS